MAAVRKLHTAPEVELTIAEMVEEAGDLNARIGNLKKAYDAMRLKIAHRLSIPDGQVGVDPILSDSYQADYSYEIEAEVDPVDLKAEVDADTFYRLISVNIGATRTLLSPTQLGKVLRERYKSNPTLRITKRKRESQGADVTPRD